MNYLSTYIKQEEFVMFVNEFKTLYEKYGLNIKLDEFYFIMEDSSGAINFDYLKAEYNRRNQETVNFTLLADNREKININIDYMKMVNIIAILLGTTLFSANTRSSMFEFNISKLRNMKIEFTKKVEEWFVCVDISH